MLTKRAISKARVSIPVILCGIMVFWSIQAFGEEWTEAQKEVWSAIENQWDKIKLGDLDGIEASLHNDALLWWNSKDTPLRKVIIMGAYILWLKNAKPVTYELTPYSIQIFGDIANVFHFYKFKAETKYSEYGRALISLKKQDGKWLVISSIHDSCERLPLCLD